MQETGGIYSVLTEEEKQERLWGMLCHLSALAGLAGVPFGNIAGPLIVWLIKRQAFRFVNDQGKESLNFQISMTIYFLAVTIATLLGIAVSPVVTIVVGVFLFIAIGIFGLVLVIIASIRANNGRYYRYPLTIRFLK